MVYPMVNQQFAIEIGPVEIVDLLSYKRGKPPFFPSFSYDFLYFRGFPMVFLWFPYFKDIC